MRLPDGVTNRQLHHWRTTGKIFPPDDPRTEPGRGHHVKWEPKYLRKLYILAYLYNSGVGLDLASRVAEEAANSIIEYTTVVIAPGVAISVSLGSTLIGELADGTCA